MAKKEKTNENSKPKVTRSVRTQQKINDRQKLVKKPKQKSLLEMQQVDGKLYNKYGYKSLDEILGIKTSKYKTHDVKEYEMMLNNMNVSDLQAHAVSVQVMPKEDRRLLTQLLIKQFKINNSSFLNPAKEVNVGGKKMNEEALNILSEGR